MAFTMAAVKLFPKIAIGVLLFLLLLILLLILMISAFFSFLNPSGEALQENAYYKAKEEIKVEYSIENDLEISYLQCMDLLAFNRLKENQAEIKSYIRDSFIKEATYETVVDDEIERTTVTVFFDENDLKELMKQPPYNLSDEDIEFVLAFTLIELDTPLLGRYPLPMNGSVTSLYGNRINPVTGHGLQFHAGIDISGAWHAKIASIANGIVQKVSLAEGVRGNYVVIKHETSDGIFYSVSQHMSAILVNEGDIITKGQVVGFEGGDPTRDPNPGDTTGHHLHFEIWKTTSPKSHVDPAKYILK